MPKADDYLLRKAALKNMPNSKSSSIYNNPHAIELLTKYIYKQNNPQLLEAFLKAFNTLENGVLQAPPTLAPLHALFDKVTIVTNSFSEAARAGMRQYGLGNFKLVTAHSFRDAATGKPISKKSARFWELLAKNHNLNDLRGTVVFDDCPIKLKAAKSKGATTVLFTQKPNLDVVQNNAPTFVNHSGQMHIDFVTSNPHGFFAYVAKQRDLTI